MFRLSSIVIANGAGVFLMYLGPSQQHTCMYNITETGNSYLRFEFAQNDFLRNS